MSAASIADLAATAFDTVATALPDVVRPCTLSREYDCAFDPGSGMVVCQTMSTTGRVIFDVTRPTDDMWPGLAPGPQDLLCWLEGLEWPPQEADELTLDDTSPAETYSVQQVADVALSSGGYAGAVVRRVT